jgi:hypothetical protein
LIFSILALRHQQFVIVQASLVGSVVSNALLVQGMAFCASCKIPGKKFDNHAAQASLIQLTLFVSAQLVVKAFPHFMVRPWIPPNDCLPLIASRHNRSSNASFLWNFGCANIWILLLLLFPVHIPIHATKERQRRDWFDATRGITFDAGSQ